MALRSRDEETLSAQICNQSQSICLFIFREFSSSGNNFNNFF